MSSAVFNGLNPQQREAVAYLDGPCLVLAGAGSGKTRVITQKIVHMIETGQYEAKHIAALTFTNKAAAEMRDRISRMLSNTEEAAQLTISTFHALGVQILRQEYDALGMKPRFSILDSDDCFALIQDLSKTTDRKIIRDVQTGISLWKNAMVTPEMAVKEATSEQDAYVARVYRNYAATLSAYQAVDFDDLIRLPVELFRQHPDIRDRWQRRLRYLLVDEYQDTNVSQYELVKLLVTGPGKKPMFTAVGDDDQAIYAWRGATIENLKSLQQDFPDIKVIRLEQNYRSSMRILHAANSVIGNNPKLFEKKLWSEHGLGDPVSAKMMPDEEQEAEQVVMQLSNRRFERRAKYADFAILYRSNYQARVFETALRRENIPYTISGGQSFFSRAEIRDLIAYLRLIANLDDDPAFIRAITTPRRGVGEGTLSALGTFAGQWRCSLFEAAYKGGIEAKLPTRQLRPLREFCDFINRIEERAGRPSAKGEPAAELLDELVKAIDYERYLYDAFDERTAKTKWQNVLEFTDWLKAKCCGINQQDEPERTLLEVTQMVALMTMLEGKDEQQDAVHLSTLHAAKGLEFPHVFLVGVEEGLLPHTSREADDLPDEKLAQRIQEERRLMYVGITRAQRTLQVSWCKKRHQAREIVDREPSRFIREMKLDEGDAVPKTDEVLTPKQRIARLKALLNAKKT